MINVSMFCTFSECLMLYLFLLQESCTSIKNKVDVNNLESVFHASSAAKLLGDCKVIPDNISLTFGNVNFHAVSSYIFRQYLYSFSEISLNYIVFENKI